MSSPAVTFCAVAKSDSSGLAETRPIWQRWLYTHAHFTHVRVVFMEKSLSGDKMPAVASARLLRPAPALLKATIWQHFGFYEVEGKMDKTYTVCQLWRTRAFGAWCIRWSRGSKYLLADISQQYQRCTMKQNQTF